MVTTKLAVDNPQYYKLQDGCALPPSYEVGSSLFSKPITSPALRAYIRTLMRRYSVISLLHPILLRRCSRKLRNGWISVGVGALLCLWQPFSMCAEIPLPTQMDHYEKFKPGISGVALAAAIFPQLDSPTQQILSQLIGFVEVAGLPKTPPLSQEQAVVLLKQVDWSRWRPQILDFFVHQSQALDMIPPQYRGMWVPIVHDSLLYFLHHLSEDRLLEKFVAIAFLPPGTDRGSYLLTFAAKTPSLQKIGQILARNKELEQDYQAALQQLENSIQTTPRDELVEFIEREVGRETVEKYQLKFADKILAEASIGAVIHGTFVMPGESRPQDFVCKVVKPYVLSDLPEELAIFDGLADYFSRHRDFYHIYEVPVSEIFQDIKKSLSNEIQIVQEQQNFKRAREYYRKDPKIEIPEIYPFSNEHVTFMQFVQGVKIADAFPGDATRRAILARRLSDALTFDVMFSSREQALFHGDPHSGNVYHVTHDQKDPYRIALLDWGLYGVSSHEHREDMMQLILGIKLADPKRLRNHVGVLIDGGLPKSPEQLRKIDEIIAEVIKPKQRRSVFDGLAELTLELAKEGYKIPFNLNLFVKSQLTISGILAELDPNLKQDDYLEQRTASLVKKEMPKRLLFTILFPAWNSHSYRSMLSNEDIKDALLKKPKPPKPLPQSTTVAVVGADR
jgi:ubiquinone biosynthesis protein